MLFTFDLDFGFWFSCRVALTTGLSVLMFSLGLVSVNRLAVFFSSTTSSVCFFISFWLALMVEFAFVWFFGAVLVEGVFGFASLLEFLPFPIFLAADVVVCSGGVMSG